MQLDGLRSVSVGDKAITAEISASVIEALGLARWVSSLIDHLPAL